MMCMGSSGRSCSGGTYHCHHCSAIEAIAHLEAMRGREAEYLVMLSTALWWLEHYDEFTQH
jgi:hypothetical protein